MTAIVFRKRATEAERAAVMARIRMHCDAPQGEGGCWLWRGGWTGSEGGGGGRPVVSFRGRPVPVRHVVYFLTHGAAPPPGLCICACGVRDCVAPGCVRAASRSQAAQIAARAGVYSSPQAHQSRKAAAQVRVRYDDATVARVRALPCSNREAARLTGMSLAHVANIRAGRARTPLDAPPPPPRETRQQSSIRHAAARAAQRTRDVRMAHLQSAQAVAGMWAALMSEPSPASRVLPSRAP